MRRALIIAVVALVAAAQELVKFEVSSNLVVVNVTVRHKSGEALEGLKKEDFAVYEDDVKQSVAVFEFQKLTSNLLPPIEISTKEEPAVAVAESEAPTEPASPGELRYKDRRLIVLYFDLSSMRPAEELRAQQSALKFLRSEMTASDMVSVMSFTSSLEVAEDFTDDRDLLIEAVENLPIGEIAEAADTDVDLAEGEEDDGHTLFIADSAEFNVFNTDRRLSALETAAKHLSVLPEKKALVYFSAGAARNGIENESQLRATINSAIKGNVVVYPVDARGLVALPPGGDATQASKKGTAMFSGKVQREAQGRHVEAQETLYSLAADTGGKALLDANDLATGIVQAQRDMSSYYILGYYSTNAKEDGRFRRLKVKLSSDLKAKLEHRAGYYANKVWQAFTSSDRERQLEEALQLGHPRTELPIALEINWFRMDDKQYFVPLAVKVPGSFIPLTRKDKDHISELDFIGQVRNSKGRTAASVRDTLTVKVGESGALEWSRRHLSYDTGFALPPGRYKVKFLARENQTGKIGTFEAGFEIPDLNNYWDGVRLSTVVLSGQREPATAAVAAARDTAKLLPKHPLVKSGEKLVPSITRVFRRNKNLYVYFEVYDPREEFGSGFDVAASLSLFRGRRKVFEAPALRPREFIPSRSRVVPFEFEVPLGAVVPGEYVCQVNVVDQAGGRFAFRRAPVVVLP